MSPSKRPGLDRFLALKETIDITYIYLHLKTCCVRVYMGFLSPRLLKVKETMRCKGYRGRRGGVSLRVSLKKRGATVKIQEPSAPLQRGSEMKPKLLVHPSQARTISSPEEVERLLSLGWVLAAPKPKTVMAKRMRSLRARRRAAGWVNLNIWLDALDLAAVTATQRPGESVAAMLMRLVRKQSLM